VYSDDVADEVPTFLGALAGVIGRAQRYIKLAEDGKADDPSAALDTSLADLDAMLKEMRNDLNLHIELDMDACSVGRLDIHTPQRVVFLIETRCPKRTMRGNSPDSIRNITLYRATITPLFDGCVGEVSYLYGRWPETEYQDKRTELVDKIVDYVCRRYSTPTAFIERVKYKRRMRYVREVEDGVHNDAE